MTGDYSEAGLVDDVSDLSFSEMLTLQNWLSFYEKNYKFIGRYSAGHFHRFHLVVLNLLHCMRDLSSLTRDRTHAPCIGRSES